MNKTLTKLGTAAIAAAVLFTASCKAPESSFTADKVVAQVGEVITFTDGAGEDAPKKAKYTYDFGDGSTSDNVTNPSHAYSKAGVYTVNQYIVKSKGGSNKGKTGTSQVSVTITSATADFTTSNATPGVGELVTLTNTTTGDDGLGSPVTYKWYFNGQSSQNSSDKHQSVNVGEGTHIVKLVAMQGDSKTEKEMTVTVGTGANNGLTQDSFQGMLAGKWNVAVAGAYTGAFHASCSTGFTTSTSFTTLSYDEDGNSTYGASTAQPEILINSSGSSIKYATEGYAQVNSGGLINNTGYISEAGLYKILEASNTKIVLEKVGSGQASCGSTLAYTETLTITLTK